MSEFCFCLVSVELGILQHEKRCNGTILRFSNNSYSFISSLVFNAVKFKGNLVYFYSCISSLVFNPNVGFEYQVWDFIQG